MCADVWCSFFAFAVFLSTCYLGLHFRNFPVAIKNNFTVTILFIVNLFVSWLTLNDLIPQIIREINTTYCGLQTHCEFSVEPFISLVSRFGKHFGNSIVDVERVN